MAAASTEDERSSPPSTAALSATLGLVTQTKQRTQPDALESVIAWRRESLERAGYDSELADQIAQSDADLHRAIQMLKQGCAPELAAQILL